MCVAACLAGLGTWFAGGVAVCVIDSLAPRSPRGQRGINNKRGRHLNQILPLRRLLSYVSIACSLVLAVFA
jgi:hypothetical protein